LDVGNILIISKFDGFLKKLSKTLNITTEEANYFMNRTQKLHDLGYTNMSDELRDHFKIRSQSIIDELTEEWNNVIIPSDFIIDIVNNLSKKYEVKIALLSNVGLEHSKIMQKVLDKGDFLKDTIKYFSCYVGARKPSLLYYHTFLQLNPEWVGAAYLDDLQENLDASKQFGFKTFRFSLEDNVGLSTSELKAKSKEIKNFLISCKEDKKNS